MFEAWTLRKKVVEGQEEELRIHLRQLSDKQRAEFYKEYNYKLKDPDTYAVLNWCFVAGMHNFYLGQWVMGLIDLSLMICGFILLLSTVSMPLGWLLISFVILIELPALFRSQLIVADYNNKVGMHLLRQKFSMR